MRVIFSTCIAALIFVSFNLRAQIAKSFYFNGNTLQKSGTYVEPDGTGHYFTAVEKFLAGKTETVITKLNAYGHTIWHTTIPHTGTPIANFAVCDLKVWNSYAFVSVYHQPVASPSQMTIYKLDDSGNLLDSVAISATGGLKANKSGMDFDDDNILFTGIQDIADNIHLCRIDPLTMDIISQSTVGTSSLTNTNATRGIFAEFNGTHAVLAFNLPGSVQLMAFDGPTLVDDFNVPSPDGEMTDFTYRNAAYHLLINKHFLSSTAADNPLRLITFNAFGAATSGSSYPVQNAQLFENLAVDDNGDIYVVSRGQQGTSNTGCLLKLTGGGLAYEYLLRRTDLNEIDISGYHLIASGAQRDMVEVCQEQGWGSAFIRHKKTVVPDFEVASPHMEMEFNNISATIAFSSSNFTQPGSNSGYTVSGAGSTIYASSLLIAGVDINGLLHTATGHSTNVYAAGPVTNPVDYTTVERDRWERVWKVTREQIDAHVTAYQAGDASYLMPEAIRNWPGNGDPAKGQPAVLTHFQDLDGNGVYEPGLGEYPLIIGDYCVLSIYNDLNSDNCAEQEIGTEIHEYAYGFLCTDDSALQNTLYVHYEIHNRGTSTLYGSYVGSFVDMDINTPVDDFISSDPLRGIFYQRDGSSASGPEQAFMILGGTADADGLDNAGGIGPNQSPNGLGYGNGTADDERLGMTNFMSFHNSSGPTGDPFTSQHYYQYMQSIWMDGTPLLYGGDGYSSGVTALEAGFMYPGDSDYLWYATGGIDPGADWSEETAGNIPSDRRGLASSGPFTLLPLNTISYDVAYVTGMENTTAGYSSHEAMIAHVDSARSYYVSNATPCGQDFDFYVPFDGVYPSLTTSERDPVRVILYPNPSNGQYTISGLEGPTHIILYNISGEVVMETQANQPMVSYDCSSLARGVYFIRFESETASGTIKLIRE